MLNNKSHQTRHKLRDKKKTFFTLNKDLHKPPDLYNPLLAREENGILQKKEKKNCGNTMVKYSGY